MRLVAEDSARERVLFVGTQFSILYKAVITLEDRDLVRRQARGHARRTSLERSGAQSPLVLSKFQVSWSSDCLTSYIGYSAAHSHASLDSSISPLSGICRFLKGQATESTMNLP